MKYKTLSILLIGLIIGLGIGIPGTYLMLKPQLGDKYEIIRPKIKGNDNNMHIEQENIKKSWKEKRKEKKKEKNIEKTQ